MIKEERELLRHISETLDEVLAVLLKPPGRMGRIFEFWATVVGILGILNIIDVIKIWIGG